MHEAPDYHSLLNHSANLYPKEDEEIKKQTTLRTVYLWVSAVSHRHSNYVDVFIASFDAKQQHFFPNVTPNLDPLRLNQINIYI